MAFVTAFFLYLVTDYASAASTTTIRVAGEGATIYEARQEAIRQALQIAVRQLVVAQRVVSNDKLVLDKVSSTMNGFVNRFTIVKAEKIRGNLKIEAEVEVSDSRIENFVGGVSGSRTTVDTDNVLASIQNEKLLREARGQVALSLFGDFPGRAIKASPVKLSLAPDNPDDLIYQTELQWDPVFLKTLTGSLKAIGAKRKVCTNEYKPVGNCGHYPEYPTLFVCFAQRASFNTFNSTYHREIRTDLDYIDQHFLSRRRDLNHHYEDYETDRFPVCWAVEPADTSLFRPPADGVSLVAVNENQTVADGVFAAAIVGNNTPIQVQGSPISAVEPGNPRVPGPCQPKNQGYEVSPAFLILWEGPHLTMIFNTAPCSINGRFKSSVLDSATLTLDVVPMVVRYTGDYPSHLGRQHRLRHTGDFRTYSVVSEIFPQLYEARTRQEIDAYISKSILEMVAGTEVK
jgi:hypothetical protein